MSNQSFFRILADVIAAVHFVFVLWVVVGLVVILVGGAVGWGFVRNRWFRLAHLASIGFVVVQAWLGELCPLTIWENRLREAAGQNPRYPDGFIAHWVHRLMYFDAPPEVFLWSYTAFGLLVVLSLWFVPMGRGRKGV